VLADSDARVVEVAANLDQTADRIEAAAVGVVEISNSVREQSAASQQIAQNVETVSQAAQETEAAVTSAGRASARLSELAGALKSSVAVFRLAA
jgi:methyl-accepting chemotaxis protein